MLFAAGVDVFASMVCLSKQVSVTIVITRQNQSTPMMEVRGVEPLSEPIRKVTYPQKGKPTVGFEPTTFALQKRCSTTELCWQFIEFKVTPLRTPSVT